MAAKLSTKHPYAAIEHRVIDSDAYADLPYSARSLLILITRQLSKDNNGHLQATHSYMSQYGFSENTLGRAIKELISHGMIYRTCADRMKLGSDDYKRIASKFAVTWLPITNRKGLYLDGFLSCAWRKWEPVSKKIPTSKLVTHSPQIGGQPPSSTPKFDAVPPPKTNDNVLMPCSSDLSAHPEERIRDDEQADGYWDTDTGELIRTPAKSRIASPAIDKVRGQIIALADRRAA